MCCASAENGARQTNGDRSAAPSSSTTTMQTSFSPTTSRAVVDLSRPLARPMGAAHPGSLPQITREHIELVKNAIEQELAARGHLLSDAEIIDKLGARFRFHPLVVSIVLSKLREQNAEFFAAYDAKRSLSVVESAVPEGGSEGEEEDLENGSGSGADDAVVPTGSFASMMIC